MACGQRLIWFRAANGDAVRVWRHTSLSVRRRQEINDNNSPWWGGA
jgi:hypothetical protein